jgi:hypothetical protein
MGAQLFNPDHEPFMSADVDVGGMKVDCAAAAMIGDKAYLLSICKCRKIAKINANHTQSAHA